MSLIRVVSKLSSMEVLPTERRMDAHAGYSGLSAFKKANKTSSILISRLSSIIARRCVWKFLNLGLRFVAHGIFSLRILIIHVDPFFLSVVQQTHHSNAYNINIT